MKKKSIIASCIAVIAIVLGILGYMYFDTYCDTYIIKLTPNKTELMRTLHTEDTIEANRKTNIQIKKYKESNNNSRNYYEDEIIKSIKKLYSNGFNGNIYAVLYGDFDDYYYDCLNLKTMELTSQIGALYKLIEETNNTSYSVIIFKHNHFWKPKKLTKKELTKQLLDIKNHKDKMEEAKKKYRAEIYYDYYI